MSTAPLTRLLKLSAVGLAVIVTVAGCSGSDEADTPAPVPSSSSSATGTPAPPSPGVSAPTGVDPQALSEEVLAAGAAAVGRPALASRTADVEDEEMTLDVMEIRRTRDGTLAEFRLSSTRPDVQVGASRFEEDRLGAVYSVTGIYLDDPSAGLRYRPLQYDDEVRGVACICPIKPIELGPEPQTLYALFPPLPDGVTTVTFRMHDAFEVPDVPVTR